MDRNESYDMLSTHALDVKLAWASLEVAADDVESIQLLISGNDADVEELQITCAGGVLSVRQKACGLRFRPDSPKWMQVLLRMPRAWKGAVKASTVSGALNVRGLTGTDLALRTVNGPLRAERLEALTLDLRTAMGLVQAEEVWSEKLTLRTLLGDMETAGTFRTISHAALTGALTLTAYEPFEQLTACTLTGGMTAYAPIREVNANRRGLGGRLLTDGMSIRPEGPKVSALSAAGNVELINTLE